VKTPQTYAASRYRPAAETRTEVFYAGCATLYGPAEGQPWASTELHFTCGHKHREEAAAEKCGGRLRARRLRELNAKAAEANRGVPCARTVVQPHGADDLWLMACLAHNTSAHKLHDTADLAGADNWACPWQEQTR